jgi:hypothetical protein
VSDAGHTAISTDNPSPHEIAMIVLASAAPSAVM